MQTTFICRPFPINRLQGPLNDSLCNSFLSNANDPISKTWNLAGLSYDSCIKLLHHYFHLLHTFSFHRIWIISKWRFDAI